MVHPIAEIIVEQAAELYKKEVQAWLTKMERTKVSIRVTLRRRFCWLLHVTKHSSRPGAPLHLRITANSSRNQHPLQFTVPAADRSALEDVSTIIADSMLQELSVLVKEFEEYHEALEDVVEGSAQSPEECVTTGDQDQAFPAQGEVEYAETLEERMAEDTREARMVCHSDPRMQRLLVRKNGATLCKVLFDDPQQLGAKLAGLLAGLRFMDVPDRPPPPPPSPL
mmetsp:Transcript_23811/g.60712  ORF Transcript_23811/g.60712 Transcript_23811/m.60712 type:complete len:225 (-) Transcript_23811:190-864(-)